MISYDFFKTIPTYLNHISIIKMLSNKIKIDNRFFKENSYC